MMSIVDLGDATDHTEHQYIILYHYTSGIERCSIYYYLYMIGIVKFCY